MMLTEAVRGLLSNIADKAALSQSFDMLLHGKPMHENSHIRGRKGHMEEGMFSSPTESSREQSRAPLD